MFFMIAFYILKGFEWTATALIINGAEEILRKPRMYNQNNILCDYTETLS